MLRDSNQTAAKMSVVSTAIFVIPIDLLQVALLLQRGSYGLDKFNNSVSNIFLLKFCQVNFE